MDFIIEFLWEIIVNSIIIVSGGTVLITFVCAKYYKKTSSDKAFVRTGAGGNVVVCDGGALVLPMYQEVKWVRMSVQKVTIFLEGAKGLVTKDRFKVNIKCCFYLKVQPETGSILAASRSLGEAVNHTEMFLSIMKPKMQSALRDAFLEVNFRDIKEKNEILKNRIFEKVCKEVGQNGLTLESFTVIECDQTPVNELNDQILSDMESMVKLTKNIEDLKLASEKIKSITALAVKKEKEKAA